jgi:O-antigen/teichoic acid export membrane protein
VSLRTYAIYNLFGSLTPALVALVTVPLLLASVGEARFGVLTLVWLLTGHFAVFDFGLARGTANHVAKLGVHDDLGRRKVLWTSLWLNLGFGALGAVAAYVLAAPLLTSFLSAPEGTRAEALAAVPWIALAVPLATVTGVLAGALDGRERFDVANGLQALGAALGLIAPVVAAQTVSVELPALVAATVLARALTVVALFTATLRFVAPGPALGADPQYARSLFNYGAWLSVSALIMPFFVSLDKFAVGAFVGAAAVAYYAVPDQLTRRITALPVAFARGAFPRLSAAQPAAAVALALKSAQLVVALVTPAAVGLMVVMHPFLSLWLGEEFAAHATAPGVVLAAGIWLNSLAMIPSSYLQAAGRPDATAKAHLIEILPHALVLWAAVSWFGIVGAAIAVLLVTILDTALLLAYARLQVWRAGYFWQGTFLIGLAGLVGWVDEHYELWRYTAALALALGSVWWAMRTSPELHDLAARLYRKVTRRVLGEGR